MRVALVALLTLILAPSAFAAWTDPVDAGVPQRSDGVVTPNGTTAFAWSDDAGVHLGNHVVGAGFGPQIAAAGNDVAVAWTSGNDALVTIGGAPPTDLGVAYLGYPGVLGNSAGAFAVLLLHPDGTAAVSYRPPGGAFGTLVPVPAPARSRRAFGVSSAPQLALGPTGELLATWRSGGSMYASSSSGGGAFGPAVAIPGSAPDNGGGAAAALDAHGRAVAAWQYFTSDGYEQDAIAARGVDGTWRAVADFAGAPDAIPQVVTGDDGQALVGWMESGRFSVAAVAPDAATRGTPTSYPVDLSPVHLGIIAYPYQNASQAPPELLAAPDGTATLTWGAYRDVLVARRDGTAGFAPPTVAGCAQIGPPPEPLGLDAAGRAYVLYARHPGGVESIAHDGVSGAQRTCPKIRTKVGNPRVTYRPRHIVAGHPVRIRVVDLRRPTATMRNAWSLPGRFVMTTRATLTYTFPKPGRAKWSVDSSQTYEGGGSTELKLTRHPRVFARGR